MSKERNKKQPVRCGQDFRDWEGYKISQVQSNKLDREVRIDLIDDSGHTIELFVDNICLDGELLLYRNVDGDTDKK